MASWLHRHHGSPAQSPPSQQQQDRQQKDLALRIHRVDRDAAVPSRLGRRPDELGVLDNAQIDVESSSESESELHPPAASRSTRHSRSMSHPFPSLFASKKKKQPENASRGAPEDSDSTDGLDYKMPAKQHPTVSGGKNRKTGERDSFMTGNCITCGSHVRWPRELKVFKCTICQTVNDLQPHPADTFGHARPETHLEASSPPKPTVPEAQSISLERTKELVKQCLRSFLTRTLGDEEQMTEQADQQPQSPIEEALQFAVKRYGSGRSSTRTPGDAPANASSDLSSFHSPRYHFHEPPTLYANPLRGSQMTRSLSYSSSYPERLSTHRTTRSPLDERQPDDPKTSTLNDPKRIFKPLEDYIITCFSSFQCISASFPDQRLVAKPRRGSASVRRHPATPRKEPSFDDSFLCVVDPKLLLLGDFAENGSWWTGRQEGIRPVRTPSQRERGDILDPTLSPRSPHVNWAELDEWYRIIINAAESWPVEYGDLLREQALGSPVEANFPDLEARLLVAQDHTQRLLLKATEMILKRPGRSISNPEETRFLLILLENPLLYGEPRFFQGRLQSDRGSEHKDASSSIKPALGPISGHHSAIIKRILGLISNSAPICHNFMASWLSQYPWDRFVRFKELAAGFLTYRLLRQSEQKQEAKVDIIDGLIPSMSTGQSVAALHAAVSRSGTTRDGGRQRKVIYNDDWQIRAAARVLAVTFAANNLRQLPWPTASIAMPEDGSGLGALDNDMERPLALPTSDFYNTLLEVSDLVADFDAWEAKRGKFTFCQYPFLLSIGAKIKILEYDAKRQMQRKARDAFFDSIMTRKNFNQFLELDVRRDCLVEDSLQAVSEVVGSGNEDIKKALRITFRGEEGVDAGGLRKEWFLLLIREVFNPDHGMFTYDADSRHCYFNPNSFETSDQFFLVGAVMGLAIYNSTILDVALPHFAFRKLLAAAPIPAVGSPAHPRPTMNYTLDDLAQYKPRLADGLRQLLLYEGDVEEAFGIDFAIAVDRYGIIVQVPLCPGGQGRAVTNANRREYVDLYVRYVLDVAVARQFEPFKRGFFTVCGGNALSMFRAEEIERLIRGSDETFDVASLRAVARYSNWRSEKPDSDANDESYEPTVAWFWDTFRQASPQDQRKLLLFITGSDRVPALGATQLSITILCLSDDVGRFPIARTCFNQLALYRYETKEKLEAMLWRAVHESEGFGLK